MAEGRQLSRSTIEQWSIAIIGIIAAAIPMNWELEGLLLVAAALLIGDLLLHSPITARTWLPFRLFFLVSAWLLIAMIGRESIVRRFTQSHSGSLPLWLESASRSILALESFTVLVPVGLACALMALWGGPSWRWRHWLLFEWRSRLATEVWISAEQALNVVKTSKFAEFRRTKALGSSAGNFLQAFSAKPPAASREVQFEDWCGLVLRKLWSTPGYHRIVEGKIEYNETKLRMMLNDRYSQELEGTFGAP